MGLFGAKPSRPRSKLILPGYDEQVAYISSGSIKRLNEAYRKSGLFLTDMKERIKGYKGGMPLQTKDGYKWKFGYRFEVKGFFRKGEVAVLFPKILGTRFEPKLERNVEVYIKGKVKTKDLDRILFGIADHMKRVYSEMKDQKPAKNISSIN